MSTVVQTIEEAVLKLVEDKSDVVVDLAAAALEKAIPGTVDDLIIEKIKPELKVVVKKELEALVHAILDKKQA